MIKEKAKFVKFGQFVPFPAIAVKGSSRLEKLMIGDLVVAGYRRLYALVL